MVGAVADWSAVGVPPPEPPMVLPYVLRYLTNPLVASIGLGALAAAVMSSIDSSMLSAASEYADSDVVDDIDQRAWKQPGGRGRILHEHHNTQCGPDGRGCDCHAAEFFCSRRIHPLDWNEDEEHAACDDSEVYSEVEPGDEEIECQYVPIRRKPNKKMVRCFCVRLAKLVRGRQADGCTPEESPRGR